jgi:DNA-binding NarL/FixJ family response regulator
MIADDHPYFLDGLRMTIEKIPGVEITGIAKNGEILLQLVRKQAPDVIFIDILMPVMDGIDATRIIHSEFPSIGIVGLSMYNQHRYIVRLLDAGAVGYLLKNASPDELREAIQAADKLQGYFGHADGLLCRMIANSNMMQDIDLKAKLSASEIRVVQLVCLDYTSKEIASMLGLTRRTIETYRLRIHEKINVKGTAGVVVFGIRAGLYDPDQNDNNKI